MRGPTWLARWLGLTLVVAACDQSPLGDPTAVTPAFHHSTTPILQGEVLFVCKNVDAPAGTYSFTLSNVTGVTYFFGLSFTLQAGECKHVASRGGVGANITVTEVDIPAGTNLDSVVLVQSASGAIASTQTFAGPAVTATINGVNRVGAHVTFFNSTPPPPPSSVLLIIDEDGLDNGLHHNGTGGGITPSGPQFFSVSDVNDDKPGKTQRSVLRYFLNNVGRTVTVRTGQTGDEGWFAPNCIPAKWISSNSSTNDSCLTNATRNTVIDNYFGKNGATSIPAESRLDKTPHVIPLRALGLNALIGKNVCAVVYDSDLSINYDVGKPLGVNGNLMGETLGIVAFTVNAVRTLNNFSSSTLPEVQLTILDTATCGNWSLLNAPVPKSSSVPTDRIAPGSASNYYAIKNWSAWGLFY